MTALFYDEIFLAHDTGEHPERPERLTAVAHRLKARGLWERLSHPACRDATREELLRVHSAELVDEVREVASGCGGNLDPDTVVSGRSYDAALMAAGAAVRAVELVARGEDHSAFCAVRPPGHHATRERSMGFCLFNNVAVAAAAALAAEGLERVAVVDWDVHHGNGTQDIFYEDGRVFYVSTHMYPHYPGTGRESETGSGKGRGTKLNIPLAAFTPAGELTRRMREALRGPAADFRPQMVLISAGYDSARGDPLGAFMLEPRDFAGMTRECMALAAAEGGGVVACLEGGYSLEALASGVEATVSEMLAG